jgi:hypothetical protein
VKKSNLKVRPNQKAKAVARRKKGIAKRNSRGGQRPTTLANLPPEIQKMVADMQLKQKAQ